eukprot:334227_1
MTLSYSNIVSISYFAVYTLFLFVLGYIVYKQGGHETIKSKSYIKDLWAQRKIYGPILVFFYDTASDIGVLIFWYQLMKDEQNELRDYNSVNMELYFWLGISFMSLYKIFMVIGTIHWYRVGLYDSNWYDPILVIFDVYIFKTVYISFKNSREIISNNAEKRKKKQQRKKQKKQPIETQTQIEIEMASSNTQTTTDLDDDDVEEIRPSHDQRDAQMAETIFEAIPQIILQSTFVIRSVNDDELEAATSNDILIMASIIASLVSISNRYISVMDERQVVDKAKSLKPREQCPKCIQYWYIIRVLWRIFDVMSRFVVYVLVWTVIGGVWLPIWFGFVWITVVYFVAAGGLIHTLIRGIVSSTGMFLYKDVAINVCKYMETIIGLTIITIFTLIEFDCWQCSDAKERQMTSNNRIMIFVIMGWISLVGEMTLYAVMRSNEIVVEWY